MRVAVVVRVGRYEREAEGVTLADRDVCDSERALAVMVGLGGDAVGEMVLEGTWERGRAGLCGTTVKRERRGSGQPPPPPQRTLAGHYRKRESRQLPAVEHQ